MGGGPKAFGVDAERVPAMLDRMRLNLAENAAELAADPDEPRD